MNMWAFAVKAEEVWVGVAGRMSRHVVFQEMVLLSTFWTFIMSSSSSLTWRLLFARLSYYRQREQTCWCHSIAHSLKVTPSVKIICSVLWLWIKLYQRMSIFRLLLSYSRFLTHRSMALVSLMTSHSFEAELWWKSHHLLSSRSCPPPPRRRSQVGVKILDKILCERE